jgi:hypothetical protein
MLTQYGPEAGVDLTAEVPDDAKTALTFDGLFMDTDCCIVCKPRRAR